MNHLRFFAFLLVLPICVGAQVDLSFFPYYNTDLMEDLGISDAQLQQIQALNTSTGKAQQALYDALLYLPDLNDALAKLDAERLAQLQTILTSDQQQAYQRFLDDAEAAQYSTDMQGYKEMYLDTYRYLKLKDKQADALATLELDVRDAKRQGEAYSVLKRTLMQDILSPKQWKKYDKKRKKERFETTTSASITMGGDAAKMAENLRKELKILQEIYIPQRQQLRLQLEQQLTAQDRQVIRQLSILYKEKLADSKTFNYTNLELAAVKETLNTLQKEQLIDQNHAVKLAVHHDRATFERAKALGVKFDVAIDALQAQLHQLQEVRYGGKEGLFMRGLSTQPKSKTERVELVRNIAFLLVPTDGTTSDIVVNNTHQLQAYPLPARSTQSLTFQLQQAGQVRVELLDAQGRLLDILLNEQLSSGQHQRDFDVTQVQDAVFFYHIESADGVSLLKSLKVQ